MPDVLWTGGITELKKISTRAETYYIPMSPHNAMGPIQVIAGAHVMISTPNFYRQEYSTFFIEAYNQFLTDRIVFQNGNLILCEKPGLGVQINLEAVQAQLHSQ